jgi:PhzF family phenazine biosynthesis protein
MSRKLKMYQVDAFTNKLFHGNPAAVCVIDEWLSEDLMQNIALENNLSETAFVVPKDDEYEIRWFTPAAEVELCGHATLASAHVLFYYYSHPTNKIIFQSRNRGQLTVEKDGDSLTLNFPADTVNKIDEPEEVLKAFNIKPVECYQGKTDYLLIYKSQEEIEQLDPKFDLIIKSGARGVIVSAPGNETNFVSRFFAPQVGINEDPVTGSAHTTLTPVWSKKLDKKILTAKQISKRIGDLKCELAEDRVKITGNAVTYLIGEIEI